MGCMLHPIEDLEAERQNWLSRFDPDLEVRGWAWWDLTAAPTGNGVLRLWVDTWGEPSFAWEDLRWLAFVAGARTVANPVLVKPEAWAGELSVGVPGSGRSFRRSQGPRRRK